MENTHEYQLTIRWSSGTEGRVSADSLPDLEVAAPPDFGGPVGFWSPEHLLVASVAACIMTTFLAIARNSKLEFSHLETRATGVVVRGEDRRYRFEQVAVAPRLTLVRESDRDRAGRILGKVHELCLVSNSLRCDVKMEPSIEVPRRDPDPGDLT